jgi:hypothetical protein
MGFFGSLGFWILGFPSFWRVGRVGGFFGVLFTFVFYVFKVLLLL